MNKFNYILNDTAFDTLVIKCLYSEPTDEDVKECENQIKLLQQENQALKNAIKRCYTPEEIDFEIMPVKAELQAEKDINNNLHKTIDKLRVNLYEKQQENKQLKDRINKAIKKLSSVALTQYELLNLDKNDMAMIEKKEVEKIIKSIEIFQTLKVLDEYKDES